MPQEDPTRYHAWLQYICTQTCQTCKLSHSTLHECLKCATDGAKFSLHDNARKEQDPKLYPEGRHWPRLLVLQGILDIARDVERLVQGEIGWCIHVLPTKVKLTDGSDADHEIFLEDIPIEKLAKSTARKVAAKRKRGEEAPVKEPVTIASRMATGTKVVVLPPPVNTTLHSPKSVKGPRRRSAMSRSTWRGPRRARPVSDQASMTASGGNCDGDLADHTEKLALGSLCAERGFLDNHYHDSVPMQQDNTEGLNFDYYDFFTGP